MQDLMNPIEFKFLPQLRLCLDFIIFTGISKFFFERKISFTDESHEVAPVGLTEF